MQPITTGQIIMVLSDYIRAGHASPGEGELFELVVRVIKRLDELEAVVQKQSRQMAAMDADLIRLQKYR